MEFFRRKQPIKFNYLFVSCTLVRVRISFVAKKYVFSVHFVPPDGVVLSVTHYHLLKYTQIIIVFFSVALCGFRLRLLSGIGVCDERMHVIAMRACSACCC